MAKNTCLLGILDLENHPIYSTIAAGIFVTKPIDRVHMCVFFVIKCKQYVFHTTMFVLRTHTHSTTCKFLCCCSMDLHSSTVILYISGYSLVSPTQVCNC
jgi:hypothetical protein